MLHTPKIAAIHDLSGYGRASLTVALPVLSVMGVECAAMPTAYLSAHTGFEGFTFLDLTEEMKKTLAHWKKMGLTFDAVYSGFMGSEEQMDIVAECIETLEKADALAVVDPVMGDNGVRYPTYTDAMCRAMRRLIEKADVITPNLTEAAFLLDRPYETLTATTAGYEQLARELSGGGKCSVVLTGVLGENNTIGAAVYDRADGTLSFEMAPYVPGQYHGTGDLFASVLTGALVRGKPLRRAARQAVRFVSDCVERSSARGLPSTGGVDFEPLLLRLGPDAE